VREQHVLPGAPGSISVTVEQDRAGDALVRQRDAVRVHCTGAEPDDDELARVVALGEEIHRLAGVDDGALFIREAALALEAVPQRRLVEAERHEPETREMARELDGHPERADAVHEARVEDHHRRHARARVAGAGDHTHQSLAIPEGVDLLGRHGHRHAVLPSSASVMIRTASAGKRSSST
jgi:hypothetical protein